MKNTPKTILVEKFEFEFDGRVFSLAIFIQGCNVSYCDQLSLEKIERILLEYFQLLQSHGYEFRKREYYIPVVIKRIRGCRGCYFRKRKEIHIARRLLDEEGSDLYETLVHELTHYFIYSSWQRFRCYKEHFKSHCYYFHEGLAELLTALMFNKNYIEINPHLLYLHSRESRNRHFSYYLAEKFFRHPGKFSGILNGHFLRSEEAFRKVNRFVARLSIQENELLNSLKTVRANFIIKADCNCTNQRGYSIYYDRLLLDVPLVSPIEQDEIETANKAGVMIASDNQLFRAMKRRIKNDFTELPTVLYTPVIAILGRYYQKINAEKQPS